MYYSRMKLYPEDTADAVYSYWRSNETLAQLKAPDRTTIQEHLAEASSCLTEKQAHVLKQRAENHMTLQAIGGEMNVTKERVRQLYYGALIKLRAAIERIVLDENIDGENAPIEMLEISTTKVSVLKRHGIETVGQLAAQTPEELMKLRTIGVTSAEKLLSISRDFISERQSLTEP